MNLSIEGLSAAVSGLAKGVGYATAVGGVYVSLGLPIPATVDYVDGKIAVVTTSLKDIKSTVLEGQLRDIVSQRNFLTSERTTLARTMTKADVSAQTIIARRMSEIDAIFSRLEREEADITKKLEEARTK